MSCDQRAQNPAPRYPSLNPRLAGGDSSRDSHNNARLNCNQVQVGVSSWHCALSRCCGGKNININIDNNIVEQNNKSIDALAYRQARSVSSARRRGRGRPGLVARVREFASSRRCWPSHCVLLNIRACLSGIFARPKWLFAGICIRVSRVVCMFLHTYTSHTNCHI